MSMTNELSGSAATRRHMIDGQLLPNDVTDESVIEAIEQVNREAFVPEARKGVAYIDFNGGTVFGESRGAYDLDGDPTTFNAAEQDDIYNAWLDVSASVFRVSMARDRLSMFALTLPAACPVLAARSLISLATTLKPRPAWPARVAASTRARKQCRIVYRLILKILPGVSGEGLKGPRFEKSLGF